MTPEKLHAIRKRYPDTILFMRDGQQYTSLSDNKMVAEEQFGASVFHGAEFDEKVKVLLRAGFRVAICESMNDSIETKQFSLFG